MARTVDQIEQSIYEQISLKPLLSVMFANPSQAAIWKDLVFCIAVCIAVFEQLLDKFKADINTTITSANVHTTGWIRQKCFEFQWDATVPQIVQINNFVPSYVPVDVTKRIVTVCCIRVNSSRVLDISVAQGSPPVKLTTPQLTAIQGYFTDGGTNSSFGTGIGAAGIAHNLISLDPDQVFIEGNIYYSGQYAANIQADVISAIQNYLANLGPLGILNTLQLTDAIQAVTGVNDLSFVNVAIRAFNETFTGPDQKHYLIQASAILLKEYPAAAGYAIGETTTGNTLIDKLTFTVG